MYLRTNILFFCGLDDLKSQRMGTSSILGLHRVSKNHSPTIKVDFSKKKKELLSLIECSYRVSRIWVFPRYRVGLKIKFISTKFNNSLKHILTNLALDIWKFSYAKLRSWLDPDLGPWNNKIYMYLLVLW